MDASRRQYTQEEIDRTLALHADVGKEAVAIHRLLCMNGVIPLSGDLDNSRCSIVAWALIRIAIVHLRTHDFQSAARSLFEAESAQVARNYGTTLRAVLDPITPPAKSVPPAQGGD